MKILITGGAGFIGSHIVGHLLKDHEVVIAARNTANAARKFPQASIVACDFSKDTDVAIWLQRLQNIDAVVNCVGILNSFKDSTIAAVHFQSPKAMFEACEKLGIKTVVHFSAIGTEEPRQVAYSDTKRALDEYLLSSNLNATILRPSFVYSDTSYGGSSLFRGLAAMPFVIPLVGKGEQRFQPIHADDVAQMVRNLLESPEAGARIVYAVGPETISLKTLLASLRAWLGLPKAPFVFSPLWVLKLLAPIGNIVPWWPLNKTTVGLMQFPDIAITTPQELVRTEAITKVKPRSWQESLARRPSGVQDLWHARLYFLHPLIRIVLAMLWIVSGLVSIANPQASYAISAGMGVPAGMQSIILYGLSGIDILLGVWLLSGYKTSAANAVQFIMVLGYTVAITVMQPMLWMQPLGPLLKNLPILALILVFGVISKER